MDKAKVRAYLLKRYLGKGWKENPQPDEPNWITKSLPDNHDLSVIYNVKDGKPHYVVCLLDCGLELSEVECTEVTQVKAEVQRLERFFFIKLAKQDIECFSESDVTELVADLYRRLHDVDALI